MDKLKVLVYGATGSQAAPVVQELLKNGHTPVVFTRDSKKAQAHAEAGAEIFEGDMLNSGDCLRASQAVDAVSLLVPFFMQNPDRAGMNAVNAAREAGVKRIVWNTSGPIAPVKTGNPAQDVRINVKEAIMGSGLPWVILEPTVYAENLLGPWTAPFVKAKGQVAYPTPETFKHGWLPSQDIGKAVVAALQKPELVGNHFTISGIDVVNGQELAAIFSEALGRQITYYAMPPSEFGGILDQAFGPGAGAAAATEYQKIWDGEVKPVMHAEMDETLDRLGVEFTPLVQWVKQFKPAFS